MSKTRLSSSDLLDLPVLIIDDILWLVYLDTAPIDWLNLRVVCKIFSREIYNLLILRHTFNQYEWRTGKRPRFHPRSFGFRMPAALYAFYLSQKILRIPAAASSSFGQMTFYVASALTQHERQQNRSQPDLETLPGHCHSFHDPKEKFIYLVCKSFATATSNRLRVLPLEENSWNLTTTPTCNLKYASVTAAAYFGWHSLVADVPDERSVGFNPTAAKIYGDVLSAACRSGCLELVQVLLERGHAPKPEYLAEAASEGHFEIVKVLAHYNNCNKILKTHSIAEVEIAIIRAVEKGHEVIVDFLLPAIQNKRHTQFFCPEFLATAANKGYLNLIKRGVALGWDLNLNAFHCVSVLGHACRAGRKDAVALLLKLGADPDGCPAPMEQAAAGGHITCMQQLLDAGADVNQGGGRLIMQPCSRGKAAAVQFLFDHGYNVTHDSVAFIKDATFCATFHGYVTTLEVLAEHDLAWDSIREAFNRADGHGRNIQHVASALEALRVKQKRYEGGAPFGDFIKYYKHICTSYCCHEQEGNRAGRVEER